ncbi:MAG: 50S ribosomal protein L30 [Clostridia bacterium]|nr:50S ribosomal protein L30 [Clostridia bacterium]
MAEKKTAAKKEQAEKMLKITLVKSTIGRLEKQKRTVEALGLKKIGSSVVKRDNAAMRGMVFVVKHLVEVEEIGA